MTDQMLVQVMEMEWDRFIDEEEDAGWGRFTEEDLDNGDREFDQSREEGINDSRL